MSFLAIKQIRLVFMVLLVGLLLLLLQTNLIQPLKNELEQRQAGLEVKQKELAALKLKGNETPERAVQEEFDLAQLESAVPAGPHLEQLLETMHKLEVVSGASMSGYRFDVAANDDKSDGASVASPGTAGRADDFRTVKMTTTVEGTYSQFIRLLGELHTEERILTVEQLDMAVQGGDSSVVTIHADNPRITCNLTVAAYYAPQLEAYIQ